MNSIAAVVANDLCIGCGLCEAVTGGRVPMVATTSGSLRPVSTDSFTAAEESLLGSSCPGIVAEARVEPEWIGGMIDPIWGLHRTMRYAWAGDADVRHRAATGGALTALGVHMIRSGEVDFVLHVGPDPERPMRSRWVISETVQDVMANTGSRYGPTSPLSGLEAALLRERPFAIIAKPCDLGAVHRLAQNDSRVDRWCVARLTMVCGGQSRLTKSEALLDEFGLSEADLSRFRYRGYGNPGPTLIETKDGRTFSKTYVELWEDAGSWDLETRCKLCPDALGEAADVSAADVWPGGSPTGEDVGFNGIIVRSEVGERLVADAVAAGDLVLGEPISPRQFDHFQPHQVRKKIALAARFAGMVDAGVEPIVTIGLRVNELGDGLDDEQSSAERSGTARRIRAAQAARGSRGNH